MATCLERLGRRAFLASGLVVGIAGCRRTTSAKAIAIATGADASTPARSTGQPEVGVVAKVGAGGVTPEVGVGGVTPEVGVGGVTPKEDAAIESKYHLFDSYPELGKRLARVELGQFPSPIEAARSIAPSLWIKRDDDFSRSSSFRSSFALARLFGGGKVRKLELYFGEARAQGKRRIITSGGVGSNQTLAVALLGQALGFSVRMHLAPQPSSTLTAKNLAADAASHAEMRLFPSVTEGHAQALRDARESADTYVIPPGGTTPLGTLGFVNAGLELAEDVRRGQMPEPRRVYVALGLGGTTAGLAIGFALAKLKTEVVGVRTSNPASVTKATLRAIHNETIAFFRARDPSVEALEPNDVNVRIDERFVGGGYGVPTAAGNDAIDRAHREEGWELDPVYTGKALAAALKDASTETTLFWNTASSRPVALADIPQAFERFAKT